MQHLHLRLSILAFLLLFHCSIAKPDACQIQLCNGLVQGNCSHPLYDSYTRIPYARPPVDDLRFEAPQPADKWNGILDATAAESPGCVEFSALVKDRSGQEDCLFVNVFVPRRQKPPRNNGLKVIIWIHPGGFQLGDAKNDPEPVMAVGGAIVVSLGYRLGPLGFLSTQDSDLPGNYGLKDQRLAIRWVEQNIAAFGGDVQQIILMGNSAGSASVHGHLISGSGRNISAFVGASGSLLNPWAFDRKPLNVALQIGALLNCPTKGSSAAFKKCLKAKTVTEIWDATNKMHTFYVFKEALFRPTIEPHGTADAFFTRDPGELIREGKYREKPFLVGTVVGEGAYLAANLLQRNAQGKEAIEELNTRWDEVCPMMFFIDDQPLHQQQSTCKKLKDHYMCRKNFEFDTYKLLERMFGDEYFHKGIDETVRLHREMGQRIYRYSANLPTRYSCGNVMAMYRMDVCFGSVHTADMFNILPPTHLATRINANSSIERDTIQNLVKLVLSMLNKGPTPSYNGLKLPANVNNDAPDQCVVLTYGKQRIDNCKQPPVNCHAPVETVGCGKSEVRPIDQLPPHSANNRLQQKYEL